MQLLAGQSASDTDKPARQAGVPYYRTLIVNSLPKFVIQDVTYG